MVELQAWQPSCYPDDIPRIGIRSVWLLVCMATANYDFGATNSETLHATSTCTSLLDQLHTHVVTRLYNCCMVVL